MNNLWEKDSINLEQKNSITVPFQDLMKGNGNSSHGTHEIFHWIRNAKTEKKEFPDNKGKKKNRTGGRSEKRTEIK